MRFGGNFVKRTLRNLKPARFACMHTKIFYVEFPNLLVCKFAMSFVKAAKWSVIYIILTLGFAAIAALGTFIWVGATPGDYEFEKGFFFSLFVIGVGLILLGILIVLRSPKILYATRIFWQKRRLRDQAVTAEEKEGMLLILVGLTLFLVWLTHYLLVGGY